MSAPAKNTVCLWYEKDAEEAAKFYAATFPDSTFKAAHKAPGDFPGGKKDQILTVEFTVMGIPCLGLNGGPGVAHSWAFSFQIATADQAETDRYWDAIVNNGGEASACGWCKDKFGVSWQVVPERLIELSGDYTTEANLRAMNAMLKMGKIDIAAIERAYAGED